MTYYAVTTLAALNALPENKGKIAAWIHAQQQPDGGYIWDYWMPKDDPEKSSTRSSYYAVATLALLGEAPQNKEKLIEFLTARGTDTQRKDGSFDERKLPHDTETPLTVGLVWFTGMGLDTLKLLGTNAPLAEKAQTYFMNAQQKNGGISKGLGVYHCYDDRGACRMQDAYYATIGLSALGGQFANPDGLAAWVKSCQHADGGFGRRPEECPTDMEATWQAHFVLSFLKKPFPVPEKAEIPLCDTNAPAPKFTTEQVSTKNADENQYLYRIAKPIYDKYIGQGEFAVAKALLFWVNDNLVFLSNYNHSSAQIIIDGLATCGPHGRAYVGLANSVGIRSRVCGIYGHGLAESKINGKWVMIDPMFADWGRNEKGELQSALRIHENFLEKGRFWTKFGDWRYESFKLEKPNGNEYKIGATNRVQDVIGHGAYTEDDY